VSEGKIKIGILGAGRKEEGETFGIIKQKRTRDEQNRNERRKIKRNEQRRVFTLEEKIVPVTHGKRGAEETGN